MQAIPSNILSVNRGALSLVQKDLAVYANRLLSCINNGQPLRTNQKLQITAYSDHLPIVYSIVEAAYRDFKSGLVSVDLKEEKLEELKARYRITEDFDYKEQKDLELRQQGAAFVTFDRVSSPYKEAGFTDTEASDLIESISNPVPDYVQREIEINPEEILRGCLDLRKGQPLSITGSREHLPQMLRLAEWAYRNGTKLLEINIDEKRELSLDVPLYKYANDVVLNEVPGSLVTRYKEFLEKNVATLTLMGQDPSKYEGIDPRRIQQRQSAIFGEIKPYRSRSILENPWCKYYLPSTASALSAGYQSLHEAAIEARQINRTGKLKEHIANLRETTDKLNILVKQGYRTLHFVSVKPNTEIPNGETDLKVSLTPKSIFFSAVVKSPSGQVFAPNIPTEECFTTPDWTKTEGVVKMTRPTIINGSVVDGIKMRFKEGRVVWLDATKNKDALLAWVEKNPNADKLGEASVVASSPIFDLGRVFNSILLDENATCHIALGMAYSFPIEGADDITDQKEKQRYMQSLNCNDSPVHLDFMIGGPNVMVFAEKADGTRKLLIKDNKFQI